MINLIPVFLLVFAAILILVLGRFYLPPGRTWVLMMLLALIAWISMIVIGVIKPAGYLVEDWLATSPQPSSLLLQFSTENWVLGFLLVSILVVILLTEAKNLQDKNSITILSGEMLLSAFGLLAIMAKSDLAFLISWVMVDLVEFGILIWIIKDPLAHRNAVVALVSRVFGILLMVFAMATGNGGASRVNFMGIMTLMIAVSRMGIIPIHRPYSNVISLRRGIGTILRFIPPLGAATYLLSREPFQFGRTSLVILLIILAAGMLYGAISWLLSKNELDGRPFWIISIGCVILASYVQQASQAVVGLMVMMVICGTALFIYSPRFNRPVIYLAFLIIGMLALPFTPTASSRLMLWGDKFSLISIATITTILILLVGVLRHFSRPETQPLLMEIWMRFFYITGMVFLLIIPWVGEIFLFDQIQETSSWWVSLVLIFGLIGFVITGRLIQRKIITVTGQKQLVEGRFLRFSQATEKFLKFSWLYRLLESINNTVASGINISIKILEGDGGLLWSFLFLILIASLLLTRVFTR